MLHRISTISSSVTNTSITATRARFAVSAGAIASRKSSSAPGAATPTGPWTRNTGDAAFDRDLPITKYLDPELVQVVFPRHLSHVGGESRSFPGPFELDLGPIHVDIIESGENQRPDLPNCGYLVTVRDLDISFLHTGDLTEPYRALEKLRGRVTCLIHMKMGLTEWGGEDRTDKLLQCIDAIEPEFLIPTHYRTDRASDPIPHGTWPPDVTDAGAFIEWIREAVGTQNPYLALHGGGGIRSRTALEAGSLEMELVQHVDDSVVAGRQIERVAKRKEDLKIDRRPASRNIPGRPDQKTIRPRATSPAVSASKASFASSTPYFRVTSSSILSLPAR